MIGDAMKTMSLGIAVTAAIALAVPAAAQPVATAPIVVSGKYQRDWQRGSRMEAEGLKELEQAQKDQVSASADVVNAQNRRDSSQQRSSNAAEEYRRLTATAPPQANARDALGWANDVQKAAASWSRFEARGNGGSRDLDKHMKNQNKAQQAVEKAQAKIARGREIKSGAEQQSAASGN
jgi:hypothetical protein